MVWVGALLQCDNTYMVQLIQIDEFLTAHFRVHRRIKVHPVRFFRIHTVNIASRKLNASECTTVSNHTMDTTSSDYSRMSNGESNEDDLTIEVRYVCDKRIPKEYMMMISLSQKRHLTLFNRYKLRRYLIQISSIETTREVLP